MFTTRDPDAEALCCLFDKDGEAGKEGSWTMSTDSGVEAPSRSISSGLLVVNGLWMVAALPSEESSCRDVGNMMEFSGISSGKERKRSPGRVVEKKAPSMLLYFVCGSTAVEV